MILKKSEVFFKLLDEAYGAVGVILRKVVSAGGEVRSGAVQFSGMIFNKFCLLKQNVSLILESRKHVLKGQAYARRGRLNEMRWSFGKALISLRELLAFGLLAGEQKGEVEDLIRVLESMCNLSGGSDIWSGLADLVAKAVMDAQYSSKFESGEPSRSKGDSEETGVFRRSGNGSLFDDSLKTVPKTVPDLPPLPKRPFSHPAKNGSRANPFANERPRPAPPPPLPALGFEELDECVTSKFHRFSDKSRAEWRKIVGSAGQGGIPGYDKDASGC